MFKIELGKQNPFELSEGLSILWDENGFILNLKFSGLAPHEIKQFKTGKMRIDIAYKEGVIFFLLEIEDFLTVSDIAFNANISPNSKESLEEPKQGLGYAMNMILTEGVTNEVAGLRTVALNEKSTEVLYKFMGQQLDTEYNEEEYKATLQSLQNRYSSKKLKDFSLAYTTYRG